MGNMVSTVTCKPLILIFYTHVPDDNIGYLVICTSGIEYAVICFLLLFCRFFVVFSAQFSNRF